MSHLHFGTRRGRRYAVIIFRHHLELWLNPQQSPFLQWLERQKAAEGTVPSAMQPASSDGLVLA
ncbi:hypothetical protein ACVXG8_14200 [Escherichia coli]